MTKTSYSQGRTDNQRETIYNTYQKSKVNIPLYNILFQQFYTWVNAHHKLTQAFTFWPNNLTSKNLSKVCCK